MAILDRNFGVVSAASTTWTVTRSTGSYGTGTVLVVVLFSNTAFTTPGTWVQRHNSVVNLGLYGYDKAGAGESSIAFTTGTAGSGVWFAWELSAGSTYLSGNASQTNAGASSVATSTLTPTTGTRHLLAAVGGTMGSGSARSVTAMSNSFINLAGGNAPVQDWVFGYRAERDVTGDGVTGYSTTGTFSGPSASAEGYVFLNYINNVGDVTPPTAPTGLTTTAIGSTTADLSWTAATDDTAVTGYELQIIGP